MELKVFLQRKFLNEWRLYCLVCVPMALAMIAAIVTTDTATAEGVSSLISYSVRWSIPWLYLAFAASSLQVLFSSDITRWLLRNRKIMGLCFATGMTWQISFIICLVGWHRGYYVDEVYVLRDVIEGLLGYAFLLAMTVTSFKPWRRRLSSKRWKVLHKSGIYILWAYAFSVYWHELFYYRQPDWIDYAFYVGGVLSWGLRMAAWTRKKVNSSTARAARSDVAGMIFLYCGLLLLVLSFLGVISGGIWQGSAYQHLSGIVYFNWLELYMPYWPFIPYLPLLFAAAGAALIARRWRLSNPA